ncbi:MAG: ABC transporter permease [Oscillospiraceae bacterium]|nr:ABC transporter permease [Oscillospiraceae bacterium]
MNIISRFTVKSMKKNPTRTLVTVLGIILSAAMFTAVTTFAVSLWTFLVESQIRQSGDYYVCADWLRNEELASLQESPDITQLAHYEALGYLKTQEEEDGPLSTFLLAAVNSTYLEAMPVHLSEGRYPQNSRELLLHEAIMPELEYYGYETALGSTISLEPSRYCSAYSQVQSLEGAAPTFTAEYTVVGYVATDVILSYDLDCYPMLTLADGAEGLPLWHRAYVKTNPKEVWNLIREEEFHDIDVNESLLALYGQSKYQNFTSIILWLTVVLCLIIVVGSVSLIYNNFSISLGERTKQFGLLSCIGATKKQLRQAVYTEALFLSLGGIPFGVLFGYSGIAITLYFLRDRLPLMLGEVIRGVTVHAVFSPLALVCGGLLALFTVFLSATVPAKRATAIGPLEAIRQNRDYSLPKRMKSHRSSLFGLPGTLAKSYYRVSRGKYRATLISLIISLVLFLSAASFTTSLKLTADQAINRENFDFSCYVDLSEAEELREQPFVERSAYSTEELLLSHVPDHLRSPEFLRYRDKISEIYASAVDPVTKMRILYLEDEVLKDYLLSQKLDPTDYLDPSNPKALVCQKELITYWLANDAGIYERYTYHYPPFGENVTGLTLFPDQCPQGLRPFGEDAMQNHGYSVDETGQLILSIVPLVTNDYGHITEDLAHAAKYAVKPEEKTPSSIHFYPIDPVTGETAKVPAAVEDMQLRHIPIGKTVTELPFGISQNAKDDTYYTGLILPLSAAPQAFREEGSLRFTTSDYPAAKNHLEEAYTDLPYTDYLQEEEAARAMILVVDIFSYGFIVLICLICTANIFNTLSTNVALRRRDFGMLRSIGFWEKDLNKMLSFECLTYGSKALLWGLPLGLLANAGIQRIAADSGTVAYIFPLKAVVSAMVSVFVIVFATMFYAASKLRKDNPIEAIREECI